MRIIISAVILLSISNCIGMQPANRPADGSEEISQVLSTGVPLTDEQSAAFASNPRPVIGTAPAASLRPVIASMHIGHMPYIRKIAPPPYHSEGEINFEAPVLVCAPAASYTPSQPVIQTIQIVRLPQKKRTNIWACLLCCSNRHTRTSAQHQKKPSY